MAKTIYKVLGPGMGKTEWLCKQAQRLKHTSKEIYVFSKRCNKFSDKYIQMFSEIPAFHYNTTEDIPEGATVLIDDFTDFPSGIDMLHKLQNLDCNLYITINGDPTEDPIEDNSDEFIQLSIFDAVEEEL